MSKGKAAIVTQRALHAGADIVQGGAARSRAASAAEPLGRSPAPLTALHQDYQNFLDSLGQFSRIDFGG